jgi:hypothetical protein
MEILKSIIFTVIGIAIGCICFAPLNIVLKVVFCIGLLCVWCAVFFTALILQKDKKKTVSSITQPDISGQNARISRNAQAESNPLDRKPMRVEKKEQYEKNRQPAKKVVLLNEEGTALLEWSLQNQTSLIIGKGTDREPVDIDLAGSAVAQMISKQHAVLNYTEKGWYVDDIDSKNGTRVKKASQNSIMDVKLVGAVEVESGDIIYIANTMLQIQ